MTKRIYLLTQARYDSMKNSKRLYTCRHCGKLFVVGNIIMSTQSRNKTNQYHTECAKKVNLW